MISRVAVSISLLLSIASAAEAPKKVPAPAPVPKTAPQAPTEAQLREHKRDLAIQGEYVGKMRDSDFALQVIALSGGKFDAVICPGGLPGAGWTKQPNPRQRIAGKLEGETDNPIVRFSGNGWIAVLDDDVVKLQDFKGASLGLLKRTERTSPTLGAEPPAGAVVLFDGTNADAFQSGARVTPDGLLMEGVTSKEEFGDCTLHVEFLLPFMPEARGQRRGNSGLYLAARYEVQMLDSFGLTGENNECGGIYTVAKPQVNMCFPPMTWQTYDVDFKAASFDASGMKTADAELTVRHNGVVVQDHIKVPGPTTSAPIGKDGPKGPIHLQNHGNPVRYRNIWVVKK